MTIHYLIPRLNFFILGCVIMKFIFFILGCVIYQIEFLYTWLYN